MKNLLITVFIKLKCLMVLNKKMTSDQNLCLVNRGCTLDLIFKTMMIRLTLPV